MHGTVDRVNPDQGFGFIVADDGQEFFFHRTALLGVDFESMAPGVGVDFAMDEHATGDRPGEHPRAVSIRLAEDAIPGVDNAPLPDQKTA